MQQDARGLSVTSDSAVAVAALDRAVLALLGQRGDVLVELQHALAADPDLALAHALAGFALRLAVRGELTAAAGDHLAAAEASLARHGGTTRERDHVAALAAWQRHDDMHLAADRLENVLLRHPDDAMALKLAHALRFMLGDATGMRLAVERARPAWNARMPGHGFILGCHAFALEETGETRAAEAIGREAVALEPRDLWGAHAVAHVMEQQGRARDGLAWLGTFERQLASGESFARHLHWHAALFHLHLGDADAALAVHDEQLRNAPGEDARDFANAASLLWRLHAQGVPIDAARWHALAAQASRRVEDSTLAFTDLHHVLALAAAGEHDALHAKLAALHRRTLRDTDTQARILAQVGLPAARGIAAALQGAPREAIDLLLPLRQRQCRLGGSHAQRDLFDRLLIEACVAAGRDDVATNLLDERAAIRSPGAWEASRRLALAMRSTATHHPLPRQATRRAG